MHKMWHYARLHWRVVLSTVRFPGNFKEVCSGDGTAGGSEPDGVKGENTFQNLCDELFAYTYVFCPVLLLEIT